MFLVKISTKDGREEKFDSKDLENDLKQAGLPERVAEEVAERVEDRVQDGWTTAQVNQETDVELRRLQEDIDRAHNTYKAEVPMGAYNVGEERGTKAGDYSPSVQPRSETKVECKSTD
jgi:hypothetical protein